MPQAESLLLFIPTLERGGGERVVSELSRHLGPDARPLIVLFQDRIQYPYGGRVICLNLPLSAALWAKPYWLATALIRFKRLIDTEQPRWIMAFDNQPNVISALVAPQRTIMRADLPLQSGVLSWSHRILRRAIPALMRRTAATIAVSEGVAGELVDCGVPRTLVHRLYNPVDVHNAQAQARMPIDDELEPIFRCPTVIAVGRLTRQKGHWHLIRAFQVVKRTIPNAKLVIVGDGELRHYLEELSARLGLSADVAILGARANPFALVSRAQVYALPSLWEGLGISLIEALACGTPVVAADCPHGPAEVLDPLNYSPGQARPRTGQFGILVPVCDGRLQRWEAPLTREEGMLGDEIARVLTDSRIAGRLAAQGPIRARDFSLDRAMSGYSRLLSDLGRRSPLGADPKRQATTGTEPG